MSAGAPFLIVAALYGASGVALGAFGAHGLRSQLSAAALDTWQTAVSYHLIHALALLTVGLWLRIAAAVGHGDHGALTVAGWAFTLGVVLFSGSLYALALGGPRLLGPITPVGGVAFIVGWLALLWAAVRGAAVP
jgi:uncharacterized membrane protein YgdD (TMEM256/DUF423 family)